ncbi:hypothetical protein J4207_00350 [Candidatus Woesearchaeota archaeon]|nr:hypothetical protein [Candidatus Woesearchaeota archaeon]
MSIDWETCKVERLAKPVKPDVELIKSLIQLANDREKTASLLPIDDVTKETVISLFYDVLRELLEALALKHGYKIYNHECYTPFLRIIISDEPFALEFDSLRKLRNGINYYGKKIELRDASRIVSTTKLSISKARKLLPITPSD